MGKNSKGEAKWVSPCSGRDASHTSAVRWNSTVSAPPGKDKQDKTHRQRG